MNRFTLNLFSLSSDGRMLEILTLYLIFVTGGSMETEAADNETQLELLLTANTSTSDSLHVTSIGIVFLNLSDSEKFEYKLRDADDWFTETLFPKDAPDVPYRESMCAEFLIPIYE